MSIAKSTELQEHSSLIPHVIRLREILTLCSKSVESGDLQKSESLLSELVSFLDSISDDATSHPDNEDLQNVAFEVVSEIDRLLSSSSLDQAVIDTLSFELPKAVSKFAGLTSMCLEIVDQIIDRFVATCSPRDMLLILCEALDYPGKMINACMYYSPLLHGLSRVFLSTQRHHFEQIKVAIPVILKVLKDVSLESEVELENFFDRAITIADSIHEVCIKLEGRVNEKLRSLLGLYVLQIMAFLSVSIKYELAGYLPLVTRLAHFLPYCGLSYIGLITGSDVETISNIVAEGCVDNEDYYMNCFSDVKFGASLAVIWGKISDEIPQTDLTFVELQTNQIKRWEAVGMLKHILSSANLPWELRRHAIDFLLCITNGNTLPKCSNEKIDCSIYMPSLFIALQAITVVIIYAPDTAMRKKAFDALKRVLADIPTLQRFDVLKLLVRNCESSSMIAILLDLVRNEIHNGISDGALLRKDEVPETRNCACSRIYVLELVESVLRPSKGGPPSLPEQGDAVLSALNLYRFALLTESKGEINCTGVLSKVNLQKVYSEWLLPLRTLVTGITAKNKTDYDQLAIETVCALNPIELVLYRCIELVEESLKNST